MDSFAGVGYFLDLAAIRPGEVVLDLAHASFLEGYIERPPVVPGSIDVVISNGVVNCGPKSFR